MWEKIKQIYLNVFGHNKLYAYAADCYHFISLRRNIRKFRFYSNKIKRRNRNSKKISVIFLVSIPEAWNSLKTVYEAANQNPDIEAHILLLPLKTETGTWGYKADSVYVGIYPEYKKVLEESTNEWMDLKGYSPDYVFFEKPYDAHIPEGYKSSDVVKYAKICYVPYGYILTDSKELLKAVFGNSFFVNVSLFFASWEGAGKYCEELFHKYGSDDRKVVYLGFPRFDLLPDYQDNGEKSNYTIMWTPRWTLPGINIKDESSDTSFFKYKDHIVSRCMENKEENWIVRPHPLAFQNYISSGAMTAEEAEAYRRTLSNMDNISLDDNKDYLVGFKKADILVTDFSSLIIEYFIMGKPIIYCGNINSLPLQELRDNVYRAGQWSDVTMILEDLKSGFDPLKETRLSASKKLKVTGNGNIGSNIIRYLISDYEQLS